MMALSNGWLVGRCGWWQQLMTVMEMGLRGRQPCFVLCDVHLFVVMRSRGMVTVVHSRCKEFSREGSTWVELR